MFRGDCCMVGCLRLIILLGIPLWFLVVSCIIVIWRQLTIFLHGVRLLLRYGLLWANFLGFLWTYQADLKAFFFFLKALKHKFSSQLAALWRVGLHKVIWLIWHVKNAVCF